LVEKKITIKLKPYLSICEPSAKLFFRRSSGGAEIDFLIEKGGQLIPVEVKWRSAVSPKDVTGMQVFLQDFKNEALSGTSSKWTGQETYRQGDRQKISKSIQD